MDLKEIPTEPHNLIMKQMAEYLTNCKALNFSCQCTGVLKHDPTNPNPYKHWAFLYQCNQTPESVDAVTDLTNKLVANPNVQIYKINGSN